MYMCGWESVCIYIYIYIYTYDCTNQHMFWCALRPCVSRYLSERFVSSQRLRRDTPPQTNASADYARIDIWSPLHRWAPERKGSPTLCCRLDDWTTIWPSAMATNAGKAPIGPRRMPELSGSMMPRRTSWLQTPNTIELDKQTAHDRIILAT